MPLTIEVVVDFACPWCRLGKVRLDRALEGFSTKRPETRVQVSWLPYLPESTVKTGGELYRMWLGRQLGGEGAIARYWQAVRDEAEGDQVRFDFERLTKQPNTLLAHRLLYRAQSLGEHPRQVNALVDALFSGHFERGEDIGDIATLASYVSADPRRQEGLADYLRSSRDAGTVRRIADQLKRQGVAEAPFFIVDRTLGVSGAQSATALEAALLQVRSAAFDA